MGIFRKLMAYDRLKNNYWMALNDLSKLSEENEKIKEQNKELVMSNLQLISEMNKLSRDLRRA